LLDAGSPLAGPALFIDSGARVRNDAGQSFGAITLTDALDYSVNTLFAEVGTRLGAQILTEYMRRFGFYAPVPLGSAAVPASGVRRGGELLAPTDHRVALGTVAARSGRSRCCRWLWSQRPSPAAAS
jgi:cell division protein FtsI/penicillin-binding protein 2